jgi:ABC-type multidrug transport system fused ATPase/permease subunit
MDMLPHLSALFSIQLVERFYDPLSGTILVDNQPISELNVQEYRKHFALVSQEPVSPTVPDNH